MLSHLKIKARIQVTRSKNRYLTKSNGLDLGKVHITILRNYGPIWRHYIGVHDIQCDKNTIEVSSRGRAGNK